MVSNLTEISLSTPVDRVHRYTWITHHPIQQKEVTGDTLVRNNVSNYSTYLPKCQRLLSGPLGRRHPSGAVHMAPSYICYMDNCFCNE